MLKKCVVAAAAAVLMAGTASAVQVNREGTGDFLIAPAYFIGNGMTTDLRVINTSSTQSVVAKVIFRHPVTSAEILDFLIYLSPSDVWTGTASCLTTDAAGQCTRSQVISFDDSKQLPAVDAFGVKFASATSPSIIISDNATIATTGRGALANQGYVEVVMASAYNIAPNKPGVAKKDIAAAHELLDVAPPLPPTTVAVGDTPNILAGFVTANVPAVGSATLPMVALEDYDNTAYVKVGVVTGLDVEAQRTSVADVEEALWMDNAAVPYVVGPDKWTLVTYTFPTKLEHNNKVDGQYPFLTVAGRPGVGKVCVDATKVYDNTENSAAANISPLPAPICFDEFQWSIFGSQINTAGFAEGWAKLSFTQPREAVGQRRSPGDNTNVGRTGAPAIVTYMSKEPNKFTWAYAPSSR